VQKMDAGAYFGRLARLTQDNPQASADGPMVEKLKTLDIEPEKDFDINTIDPHTAKGLQRAIGANLAKIDTGGEFTGEGPLCGCHPQSGKGRTARFRLGRAQPPLAQPDHIEGHRGDEVLQMGLGQPHVPRPAQPTTADPLRVRALDPGPLWAYWALNAAVSWRCRAA
jgi:hypothetical protein